MLPQYNGRANTDLITESLEIVLVLLQHVDHISIESSDPTKWKKFNLFVCTEHAYRSCIHSQTHRKPCRPTPLDTRRMSLTFIEPLVKERNVFAERNLWPIGLHKTNLGHDHPWTEYVFNATAERVMGTHDGGVICQFLNCSGITSAQKCFKLHTLALGIVYIAGICRRVWRAYLSVK